MAAVAKRYTTKLIVVEAETKAIAYGLRIVKDAGFTKPMHGNRLSLTSQMQLIDD